MRAIPDGLCLGQYSALDRIAVVYAVGLIPISACGTDRRPDDSDGNDTFVSEQLPNVAFRQIFYVQPAVEYEHRS